MLESKKTYLDWFVEVMISQDKPLTKDEMVAAITTHILLDDIKKRSDLGQKVRPLDIAPGGPDREFFWKTSKKVRNHVNNAVSKSKHRNVSVYSSKKYGDKYVVVKEGLSKWAKYSLIEKSQTK